jgi:hypothetical protein
MILKEVDRCGWFCSEMRSPHWVGYPLCRASRRDVANHQHRAEVEAALRNATKRGVVVTVAKRGSKLRYFVRPPKVEPGHVLVSDQIVDPPKPMRKLSPAPKPTKQPKVEPTVVPPPTPPPIALKVATICDLVGTPPALALLAWLRVMHGEAGKSNFRLDVFRLAADLRWAVPRVNAAMAELTRRELIVSKGVFSPAGGDMSGSYGWCPARINWPHKKSGPVPGAKAKRAAEKEAVETLHLGAI